MSVHEIGRYMYNLHVGPHVDEAVGLLETNSNFRNPAREI